MIRWVSLLVVGMVAGACGKAAEEAPPASAPAAAPAEVKKAERPALVQGYEALRDRLADDDLPGAKKAAEAFAKSAGEAGEAALAEAVGKLGAAPDLDKARLAFGEISKAYLTVLAQKPELKAGLFAFRCPMAEGYQKWVQVDEPMKNPYMGKAMLECGSKVELAP